MFDELDQAITNDRDKDVTRGERIIRYLMIALLSVLIFGGIFLGVWFLEY